MRSWLLLILLTPSLPAAPNRVEAHLKAPFEILSIAQGPGGILYLGGGAGVYRYDGFRYFEVPGYPFPHAYSVAFTNDGALWVGSRHGVSRKLPGQGFEVMLPGNWQHVKAAGPYVFATSPGHERLMRLDGKRVPQPVSAPAGCGPPLFRPGEWAIWMFCREAGDWFQLDVHSLRTHLMPRPIPIRPPDGDSFGNVWGVYPGGVVRTLTGSPVERISPDIKFPLTAGREGQVWLSDGVTVRGLSPRIRFGFAVDGSRLSVLEDSRGTVWVGESSGRLSTLIADPSWEEWPLTEFRGAAPLQVLRNSSGELIAVTESQLFRLDETERQWKALSEETHKYRYLLSLPDGRLLASTRDLGVIRLSGDGRLQEVMAGVTDPTIRDKFRVLIRTAGGRIWAANGVMLHELEGSVLRPVPFPNLQITGRNSMLLPVVEVHSFQFDPEGRLWVGADVGLASQDASGAWQTMPSDSPLHYVRSFQFRGPDEVWVAHRYPGFFSVLRKGKVTRLRAEDGYGPPLTYFLNVDRRGWIWRGTSNGVYVSNGRDIAPEDWLFLDSSGESAPYGFFEDRDGSVWLAGREGLKHIQPRESWFTDNEDSPVLSRVMINGVEWARLPGELDPPPQRLEIEFSKLAAARFRREPFQYRLTPRFSDWRAVTGGRIDLRDLAPDRYELEVRQRGSRGVFRQSMQLGPAPPPGWWWLLTPLPAMGWALRRRELLIYQGRKALYMLRRRWSRRSLPIEPGDLSGGVLRNRYDLQHPLATGGFSRVYSAIDRSSGQEVAVKILHQQLSEMAWVRVRFAQELAALRLVQHPGVVRILDSWIEPSGEPCIVMPLVRGKPLREELTGGPWDAVRAARLIEAIGDALAEVHRAGVIHRDLKPENIIVGDDESAVLVDFGTSGLLGPRESGGTTTLLAGSLEYLAPERLTGHYSAASDLYSFAAIVFEVLSGTKLAHSKLVMSSGDLTAGLAQWFHSAWGEKVSALLAEGLQPLPERRPSDVRAWSREVANALTATVTET